LRINHDRHHFERNTGINPGESWGTQHPDSMGGHVVVFSNEAALGCSYGFQ